MYYVIEERYEGLSEENLYDGRRVIVSTKPARGNMGQRPVIVDGWCGSFNDQAVYGRGEFANLEEAKACANELCGDDFRTDGVGTDGREWPEGDEDEVYEVRPPLVMALSDACDFVWEDAVDRISGSSTDGEIEALIEEWGRALWEHTEHRLPDGMFGRMVQRRDELREEGEV